MSADNSKNSNSSPKKITSKQVVAIIGVALLVIMYITTLIVSILDSSQGGRLTALCIVSTLFIPMLIWIYTWIYGKFTGKKTMADFNIGQGAELTEAPTEMPTAEKTGNE